MRVFFVVFILSKCFVIKNECKKNNGSSRNMILSRRRNEIARVGRKDEFFMSVVSVLRR